jgi:hypothetical protein
LAVATSPVTAIPTAAAAPTISASANLSNPSGPPGPPAPVTSSSLGQFPPTFAGPAATGCISSGCSLLSGPFPTPAVSPSDSSSAAASPLSATPASQQQASQHPPEALPYPVPPHRAGADPALPTVNCLPTPALAQQPSSLPGRPGPVSGCDSINPSSGGAVGVKGINAVDSGTLSTNVLGVDIEPADQGLCAGNGYVVEDNNLGEILVFSPDLERESSVISLDTVMGLTAKGWSSGGDIQCLYDYANGGHWFFTEIVSTTSEASGGAFTGCFAAMASACLEGIAVSTGSSPFGPYNVYFLSADYNPSEPGYPYLLNDFAKISVSRDAFLLFYDEFPLNPEVPGIGGGFFNGAQEFAFNKDAFEAGLPARLPNGSPNPAFNVAIENMGLVPTPDGTCASDNTFHLPGITCWYQVIPAQPPDPSQFDNSHGGSAFMLGSLDFYGNGDDRVAVFDWTGLDNLDSPGCSTCSAISFGGQLFSGVLFYYGEGFLGTQKAGPIPLGDECGAAGLSVSPGDNQPAPPSCPEGGIATNGDGVTQASQAQGQLWWAVSTEVAQVFPTPAPPRHSPSPPAASIEVHQGAVYWVVGTGSFDTSGTFTLTSQGYVSAAHEDLEFPSIAAEGLPSQDGGNGGAVMAFTLSGNGGPTAADNGGFYPSTAFGRLTATSGGLLGNTIYVADLGQSPQDGFTEYLGYPGPTRPRWGDYSAAVFVPGPGARIYFATQYIQYPNCLPPAFTLTLGTCGGTRDGFANWGTSVNYVTP